MATGMVDLSSLQTVNFGNGVTGSYDPSSGTYFDSGGNQLSASDLAQYGSFTVGSSGSTPGPLPSGATGAPATVSGAGSGSALSGMSGLFSGIGSAIANATKPPTITTSTGQALVYNPATGGYTTTTALNASSTLTPLILLVVAGAVLFLVMREERRG